jgi:tyrosyl-tRNA synthetase
MTNQNNTHQQVGQSGHNPSSWPPAAAVRGKQTLQPSLLAGQWRPGDLLVDAMVSTGMAESRQMARSLIRQGYVRLNQQPVNREAFILTSQNSMVNGYLYISKGEQEYALLARVPE